MSLEQKVTTKIINIIRDFKKFKPERPVTPEYSLCDLGFNREDVNLFKQLLEDQFHIDDIDGLGDPKNKNELFDEDLPKIFIKDIIALILKW